MKVVKEFPCKVEELPIIGGYAITSVRRDLADFTAYSDQFSEESLVVLETKRNGCANAVSTDTLNREMKSITKTLDRKIRELRKPLNRLEGYARFAATELNGDDLGLGDLRTEIGNGNTEGVVKKGHELSANINLHLEVLQSQGLKPELVATIKDTVEEIETLNNAQESIRSKRGLNTQENLLTCNDFWHDLNKYLIAGRAIYKGVDPARLKDYTMSYLIKRVNSERKEADKKKEEKEEKEV
ncbi:MAG TPA: hypothetical protein DDZ96_11170 [Porphyromonadaceae bacterium]|jgi:hypothetical protein|uniref:hypothetical protein n=1 Tax=Limibacterium fermenti TaxID=3229863 RepID=UPI000E821884|nr:hypothetical protein [Porphyromonadaceae bacterium]HBL34360.1 hypothetical protein [Porphyromonadaceae bacterium]HBX20065.1 hypothetical protein [Porphyromonadaceae bacterium]